MLDDRLRPEMALSGMLHDIGKFKQRAGFAGDKGLTHGEVGYRWLVQHYDEGIIAASAKSHHAKDKETWDHDLYSRFLDTNPDLYFPVNEALDLLLLADKMNRQITGHETNFFTDKGIEAGKIVKEWYGKLGGSIFRIGFGSGMLSTTVNHLWSDPLRQKIRNICGHDRHDDPAPKSRRLWQAAPGQWVPMGWARIRFEKVGSIDEDKPQKPSKADKPDKSRPDRPVDFSGEDSSQAKESKIEEPRVSVPEKRSRPRQPEEKKFRPTSLARLAETVPLHDKVRMDRLVDQLDDAAPEEASEAAAVLKERLEKAGQWKKSPYRTELEMFL